MLVELAKLGHLLRTCLADGLTGAETQDSAFFLMRSASWLHRITDWEQSTAVKREQGAKKQLHTSQRSRLQGAFSTLHSGNVLFGCRHPSRGIGMHCRGGGHRTG